MVADPAETADTSPALLIIAVALLLLLHAPPDTLWVRIVVAPPKHENAGPEIVPAVGNGFTVKSAVERAVPQLLV
jgi:hypothetical protein